MTRIGYRTGLISDPSRSSWDRSGPRPIAWSAWYPTDAAASSPRPPALVFASGDVAHNASLAPGDPFPVALLSHGTGGTAESLGWLARALAAAGHVVLGVNHHGNTGVEAYRPEGFLCWWERAPDLSTLLTSLDRSGIFAGRLDMTRVAGIGFSLGGHTVLALAGARTSFDAFDNWQRSEAEDQTGPREFPNVVDHIPSLLKGSAPFRAAWARQSETFADPRITALVAIAPAPPVRALSAETVAAIRLPVMLLTAGSDTEAPTDHGAAWLCKLNARFRRHNLGDAVGHYTFLDHPADRSLIGKVDIFTDRRGVDRTRVHTSAADLVRFALTRATDYSSP
ncbi:MAG: dienelactone hydrolase [Pseudomonadota bacterium]